MWQQFYTAIKLYFIANDFVTRILFQCYTLSADTRNKEKIRAIAAFLETENRWLVLPSPRHKIKNKTFDIIEREKIDMNTRIPCATYTKCYTRSMFVFGIGRKGLAKHLRIVSCHMRVLCACPCQRTQIWCVNVNWKEWREKDRSKKLYLNWPGPWCSVSEARKSKM